SKSVLRALPADAVELWPVRFRQELFPRHDRARAHPGEDAGLDLARPVADAAHLPDLDPARGPQGSPGRLSVRRMAVRGGDHRLRDPRLPDRHSADRAVRGRLVLRLVPVARAHLRELGRSPLVEQDPRLFLAPYVADHLDGP